MPELTPPDELRQAAATVRKYAHLFEGKADCIAGDMLGVAHAWEGCADTSAGAQILAVARQINIKREG